MLQRKLCETPLRVAGERHYRLSIRRRKREDAIGPAPRQATRAQTVADEIRRRIVLNECAPGTALTELAIAAELGASQGAVREAFLRLEGEGLVLRNGHKGTTVTALEAAEAAEMLALRRRIESRAAALVVRRIDAADRTCLDALLRDMLEAAATGDLWRMVRADMDFHLALFRPSGLNAMAPILARCILHTQRFRLWAPWHHRPLAETAERHVPILARLDARDARGLRQDIEAHLDTIVDGRAAA